MFSPQELLRQLLPCTDAPTWWLGLSGGMDSMVLLDALVELSREHPLPPLRAIHVHHGLHPDADSWAEHCVRECEARQVPLVVERVHLAPGASIEAQARDARYAAFARHMGKDDCLLLAHHREDQLETLLFRMLRGTGLRGLAGMPSKRALARGRLVRPLLEQSRSELQLWARARDLTWVEDPANHDPRFARSALRHNLLPALRQGWPAVDKSLLTLAGHAREANELLDERAAEDMRSLTSGIQDLWLAHWPSLSVAGLLALSTARRNNVLRYWLRLHGCSLSQRRLHALDRQLDGAIDSQPSVELEDGRLCRSSGRLWLLLGGELSPLDVQPITSQGWVTLAPDNGALLIHLPAVASSDLDKWSVRYRKGGEVIRLAGRPTQSLKHLMQEAGLPAWLRARIPLVYHGQELASVGGRWNNESYLLSHAGEDWSIRWELGEQFTRSAESDSEE
jgi:tRNA(Ile)-lysidine synthase